jgi:hypothetical protein
MEACTWVEDHSWKCGGIRGAHGLGGSIGVVETIGGERWTLSCGALTLKPLLDGCAYLGA